MTITTTTLSIALGASSSNQFSVVTPASMTGIVGPGPNKSNRIIIWCDNEAMEALSVTTANATVVRGVLGTLRASHQIGARVWVGQESDFEHLMLMSARAYSGLSVNFETITPSTAIDTATLTAEQMLGGLITGTPTAAANYTLPTAALLITALQSFGVPYIGQSFRFTIKNTSGGANTITAVAGTGATIVGTATVAQSNAKEFRVVITGVDVPAYSIYSLGTVTF